MRDERGVTLIEMILSIILIGIIGVIAAQAFFFSTKSVVTGNAVREAGQVNRMALDRMVREIRTIRDDRCVETANGSTFKFVNSENDTIEYSWAGAGSPLMRNMDSLVPNVSSLIFTYYDSAEPPVDITALPPTVCATPCAPACAVTDIWSVNIDLTSQSGTETMRFRSQVHPRSF